MQITKMQIAPPALLQAGRVVSLPHSVTTRALCDAPLLRVACNSDGALGFISADLSSLAVDPQTMGRDATRGRKAPGRTRARPAQAGRAEISKWDVDSRFHESSRVCSHLCRSRSCLRGIPHPRARTRAIRRFLARPCHHGAGHITRFTWYKYKVASPMISRRAVNGRGGNFARLVAKCREHRDATPRARTLASTPSGCQDVFPEDRCGLRLSLESLLPLSDLRNGKRITARIIRIRRIKQSDASVAFGLVIRIPRRRCTFAQRNS
jgi:hypothetical protein